MKLIGTQPANTMKDKTELGKHDKKKKKSCHYAYCYTTINKVAVYISVTLAVQ